MKKLFAILLVLAMMISVVACTGNNDNNDNNDDKDNVTNNDNTNDSTNDSANDSENTDNDTTDSEGGDETVDLAYKSALEVLSTIWATYGDDEKFFVGGGDAENMVMDGPGKFGLTGEEAADALNGATHYPTEHFAKIDDAATMMHGMVANNFTAAAYHFTSADAMNGMADIIKNTLVGTQWICGFPEKAVVVSVPGDYLVVVYGVNDAVNPFITKTLAAIEGAAVVAEQDLTV